MSILMGFRRLGDELRLISLRCKSGLRQDAKSYCCQQITSHPKPNELITRTYSTNGDHFAITAIRGVPFNKPHDVIFLQRRFRKRKGPRSTAADDEDEEVEDDDDLSGENPLLVDDLLGNQSDGSTEKEAMLSSLRLDNVAKYAFSMARQRAEEAFYKGDLYVNGEKAVKKSQELNENDEIDYIKGINVEDSNMVNIMRAQIVYVADKATENGRTKTRFKVWNDLTMPNPAKKQDEGVDV